MAQIIPVGRSDVDNFPFSTLDVTRQLVVGGHILVDFNDAKLTAEAVANDHCGLAVLLSPVSSNKLPVVQREFNFDPRTKKDSEAIITGSKR